MPYLIKEFIRSLRFNDKMLQEMTVSRKKIDPTFQPTFDMVFVFDKQSKPLFVNFMAADNLGMTPADMEGKHWRELNLSAHSMEPMEKNIKRVFEHQEVVVGITEFDNPLTCETRYYEDTFSPLYNSRGNCTAVYCVIKDITERMKAEERLSRQSRLSAQLIEKAPQAIIVADNDGKILYCNSEYLRQLPGNPEELVGKPVSVLAEKLAIPYDELSIVRALKNKEVQAEHRKMAAKDWLVNGFPLLDNNGNVLGAAVIVQDITQTLAIQEELRKLDRLNLVGQMAAGVAHEIRNPLTVVKGYLQFMGRKLSMEVNEQLQIVFAELQRIEDIISNFLSIAGSQSTEQVPSDLNQIVMDVIPLIRADAIRHNIDVKVELDENMPQLLLNDKELKQVLLNLARNAIDAMRAKGTISIKTLNEENEMVLIVADNGSGIPDEVIENVFNPFYSTKAGGVGLGLAICNSIIKKHRGRINVFSEEGKGSSFAISFPKAHANVVQPFPAISDCIIDIPG